MKKVFISGSRSISKISPDLRKELDSLVKFEYYILVGDANGVDKMVQTYLDDMQYPNVTVYHVGAKPRNNVGAWKTKEVSTLEKPGTREYFTAKDICMTRHCDFSFVIWDEKSKGSLENIKRSIDSDKQTRIYFNKSKESKNCNKFNIFLSEQKNLTLDFSV